MKILEDYILFDDYDVEFSTAYTLDSPVSIIDNQGVHYFPCVDMAFEYSKAYIFGDDEVCDAIERNIDTSYMRLTHVDQLKRIYKLGDIVEGFDIKIWNRIKFDLMYTLEFQRYFFNRFHRDTLFKYPGKIIYCEPESGEWGCGFKTDDAISNRDNWRENHLGHVIEKVQHDILSGLVWDTSHISLNGFLSKRYAINNEQLKLDL